MIEIPNTVQISGSSAFIGIYLTNRARHTGLNMINKALVVLYCIVLYDFYLYLFRIDLPFNKSNHSHKAYLTFRSIFHKRRNLF